MRSWKRGTLQDQGSPAYLSELYFWSTIRIINSSVSEQSQRTDEDFDTTTVDDKL